ncbi:MAG: hypothetical protein KBA99_12135, partial [Bacteroidia bacterium]|nr:hypothetical protein [Bacteroidia bacterium]
ALTSKVKPAINVVNARIVCKDFFMLSVLIGVKIIKIYTYSVIRCMTIFIFLFNDHVAELYN